MNSNWRNRPTNIDYVPKDINYIIGIDESGNPSLKQIQKAKQNHISPVTSELHFTVTACMLSMENFSETKQAIMNLKYKYWNNALYDYNRTVKRVCFHSSEIRGRKEAFSPSIIDHTAFISDLSQLMTDIPYKLFASHINKLSHVEQYVHPMSPYNLCMTFVLERIVMSLRSNESCVIILESRGKKENNHLLNHIKDLMNNGTQYLSSKDFSKIKGVYFNTKWCSIADDQKSYWILELADLCAYPIQKYFIHNEADKAFETLLPKIYNYPHHNGYGLKSFP